MDSGSKSLVVSIPTHAHQYTLAYLILFIKFNRITTTDLDTIIELKNRLKMWKAKVLA